MPARLRAGTAVALSVGDGPRERGDSVRGQRMRSVERTDDDLFQPPQKVLPEKRRRLPMTAISIEPFA